MKKIQKNSQETQQTAFYKSLNFQRAAHHQLFSDKNVVETKTAALSRSLSRKQKMP